MRSRDAERIIREIVREELLELSFTKGDTYDVWWLYDVGVPTADGMVENTGQFKGADGLNYKIKISGYYSSNDSPGTHGYPGTLRVDFRTREMGDDLTGSGEPLKILRTVVSAAREVFDAHGGRDVFSRIMVGSAGPKRERVYRQIIAQLFPEGRVEQETADTFYVNI